MLDDLPEDATGSGLRGPDNCQQALYRCVGFESHAKDTSIPHERIHSPDGAAYSPRADEKVGFRLRQGDEVSMAQILLSPFHQPFGAAVWNDYGSGFTLFT